jgi:hypothetical protein
MKAGPSVPLSSAPTQRLVQPPPQQAVVGLGLGLGLVLVLVLGRMLVQGLTLRWWLFGLGPVPRLPVEVLPQPQRQQELHWQCWLGTLSLQPPQLRMPVQRQQASPQQPPLLLLLLPLAQRQRP